MGQGTEKEGGSEVERKEEKVGEKEKKKKKCGAKMSPVMISYFPSGTCSVSSGPDI